MAKSDHTSAAGAAMSGVANAVCCLNALIAGDLPHESELRVALSLVETALGEGDSEFRWLCGCRYLLQAAFVVSLVRDNEACVEEAKSYVRLLPQYFGGGHA